MIFEYGKRLIYSTKNGKILVMTVGIINKDLWRVRPIDEHGNYIGETMRAKYEHLKDKK